MSINLIKLSNGEEIVADVEDTNIHIKTINIKNPLLVNMRVKQPVDPVKGQELEFIFVPWAHFALDGRVPLNKDLVLFVVEPIESLKTDYMKALAVNIKTE